MTAGVGLVPARAVPWALMALAVLAACRHTDPGLPGRLAPPPTEPAYNWQLPAGFPAPPVPADNPMSDAKVELGRWLFYDTRLSGNRTMSCASCHRQELAFTDGRARAVGSTGELHPRSAMSLVNVAWSPTFNWAAPELTELEQQIEVPMFNRSPVELGLTGREAEVEARLQADERYREMFRRAFPESVPPVTLDNVRKALAGFVRTILSADSLYDRYVFHDQREALNVSERRGLELFFSPRTHCSECHGAPTFTGAMRVAVKDGERVEARFHNTGLGAGDTRRFKAPTLRNVELTAPYMHDGSIGTLEEVVDFYAAGGRGPGRDDPHKDPLITGFEILPSEKADLVEFLKALTDRSVTADPRFGPPAED